MQVSTLTREGEKMKRRCLYNLPSSTFHHFIYWAKETFYLPQAREDNPDCWVPSQGIDSVISAQTAFHANGVNVLKKCKSLWRRPTCRSNSKRELMPFKVLSLWNWCFTPNLLPTYCFPILIGASLAKLHLQRFRIVSMKLKAKL